MPAPLDGTGIASRNVSQRKRRFIDAYRQCGNIVRAAQEANIERRTVYDWLERDRDGTFKQAMDTATEEAVEHIEAELFRRGVEGYDKPVYQQGKQVGVVREYSDTLLIFQLKALKPEKYRDHFDVNIHGRMEHAPLAGLLSEPVTIDASSREVNDDS